jgi:hypothetical protein
MEKETKEKAEPPKKSSSKCCWWSCLIIVILAVIIGIIVFLVYKSENSTGNKSAPAKSYTFPEPSSEAKNRQLDCTIVYTWEKFVRSRPLCLNLYQTSSAEINSSLGLANYDTIILYGERVILELPAKPTIKGIKNYGEAAYNLAKFTDQITMPKMMDLYGVEDLSFINALRPDEPIEPYDALYIRVAPSLAVANACSGVGSGCARGWFALLIPERFLNPQNAWTKQLGKDSKILTDNVETIKFAWPVNCMTGGTLIHEIAHILQYSSRIYLAWDQGAVTPKWFNEYQAGLAEDMAVNFICGPGSATFTSKIEGKEDTLDLAEFNGIFPPAELSHDHPKDECNQAVLSAWSKWVGKDFPGNFTEFYQKITTANKAEQYFGQDADFGQFVANITGEKELLNTHGCGF